ncbi:MAG: D-alanyl-D-alanine carboxypeptidase [Lachnospiraceae bacterium]|nr:D-alanyl-D-alanine carboxypeptidase [Lachnospiraceae bacterium]
MKCTNRKIINYIMITLICFVITGCGADQYDMAYNRNSSISSFRFSEEPAEEAASGFATDLCVTLKGSVSENDVQIEEAAAALLCDLNKKDIIYGKNQYEQMEPASLTKVMTALVALKYGNLDDVYTASSNVVITESGATLIGLKEGDTMTLEQALHGLLMSSGNDAAVLIAEGISGSVDQFCDLMNEEAKALGATRCSFKNPHGLTEEGHYVTAYDLYLIFKEAIQYDEFNEIINLPTYSTVYKDKEGNSKELSCESTNLYIKGTYNPPEHVKVIGGKTGTTSSARNCLILYAKDTAGNPYVAVILKCSERGILYEEMTGLLSEIGE